MKTESGEHIFSCSVSSWTRVKSPRDKQVTKPRIKVINAKRKLKCVNQCELTCVEN